MSKVFLIGGPGNISRGTVAYLLERNYTVAIYTNQPAAEDERYKDVRFYEGDRKDIEALQRAFADFGADLVLDTVCFEPQDAEALCRILNGKIRQLLYISTVDTYGYPLARLPLREQDEIRPARGEYAQKKRTIERRFSSVPILR